MFRVEQMQPEDFPFAVELSNTMNWNMTPEDFELASELEPEGCFILKDGSERIGIATTVSFGKVGWFGNLIVKEEYRRKGAGSRLLRHALDYLTGRGVETVGLYAYTHLVEFYKSFGFNVDEEFLALQGEPVSRVATAIPRKIQEQDVPPLIDFDSRCFGAFRTKLLEHIFLEKDSLSYISADNGTIKGYAAAKVFGKMAEVGPLVCRANHVDDALVLLETILSRLRGLTVFMCVPAKETVLLNWLFKAGLRRDFQVARMFLGPSVAANCLYMAESLERG